MQRLPDWEARLQAYLAAQADKPFAWGTNDCGMFAAGAAIAVTGEDPAAAFRGRYSTALGSERALRRYGAGTLITTLSSLFPNRDSAFARRGDLVMVSGNVGVCVGATALFVGEVDGAAGLVSQPRTMWHRCWAVG